MVTLTKCRNCGSFFPFSHTQCDILFHFNSSVAFPFLCFVLHFICEWAGWYCFYLIAYNTKKREFHEKEMMIFASEYFFSVSAHAHFPLHLSLCRLFRIVSVFFPALYVSISCFFAALFLANVVRNI